MTDLVKAVKGCKDLFGAQAELFRHIVGIARKQALLYGCSEAITPVLEHTELFSRGLGSSSDIVHKEMYSFVDKGDKHITLRPEFTAGIVRAITSNGMQHSLPLKLFSYGPVFRRENPQAGRQRQFNQINVEFLGLANAASDAELIGLAHGLLQALGLQEKVALHINSLGCHESRAAYRKALCDYFYGYKEKLSHISLHRLETNPLRILDSKEPQDLAILEGAPKLLDYLTPDSKDRLNQVLTYLDNFKIKYSLNPKIVRGLDYYEHTVFEFIDTLSLSTVIGGGRYNTSSFGVGLEVPAIGFGAGIERLMLQEIKSPSNSLKVAVIPVAAEQNEASYLLAMKLRQNNITALVEEGRKLSKALNHVLTKYNPQYVIIVGEEEVKSSRYKLKDIAKRIEQDLLEADLLNYINANG